MSEDYKTNFSKFLNGIYNLCISSVKNRNDFLRDIFTAAGRETRVYVSDETLKSVCNGERKLTEYLMNQFPKAPLTAKEKEYFMSTLNKDRLLELFDFFEIDREEKKNFERLCEAIAIQFENFMRYGDEPVAEVKDLYSLLLDSDLPKGINNNEDAVFAAKTLFYNALQEFSKIDKNKSLMESRGRIDNTFQLIFSSFKAFESRCNHAGLDAYRKIKEKIINSDRKLNRYIKLAAEPGSLPLPLVKGMEVIVYDDQDFNDIKATVTIPDDGIFGINNTITAIEGTGIGKKAGYVFFTEKYNYRLRDDKTNLLPGLFYGLTILNIFWNKTEDTIGSSDRLKKLNKKIKDEFNECRRTGIAYYYDGTYYYQDKRIVYDVMIEDIIFDRDGYTICTEDQPIPLKDHPVLKGEDFKERFVNYLERIVTSVKNSKGVLSTECLLITSDNNVRWFVTVSPARATITRKVRKMANIAYKEGGISFFWASKHFGCELEQHDDYYLKSMPKEQYDRTDFICIYGCEKDKVLSCCIKTSDLLTNGNGKIRVSNDPFMYFLEPIRGGINAKR